MMRTTKIRLLAPMGLLLLGTPWQVAAQDLRIVDSTTTNPALPTSGTEIIQHTVRNGDTLWDLSESYYASPWYWPQVWAYNPQISNPHYIYPGDLIRFQPLIEVTQGEHPAGEEKDVRSKLEPSGPTVGGARVRFVPKEWDYQVYVRYVGFVTEEEIRAAGTLRFSREEKDMLGELDEVYIDFERLPRVRPGDRWTILSLEKDLIHPVYNRKLGTKVDILGVVDIRAVTRRVAIGVIVRSYKEIRRGALVIPLVPNFRSVKPRPNAKNIRGYIVDDFQDVLNIGQHHVVFIDKGVREGVEVGNRFHVVRRGDGLEELKSSELKMLPWEPMAEVMVVESRDHHCTGIVLGNNQELMVGDVVEMRASF